MTALENFHNRDISFQDGLNVVYGKNEAGKSTLHTFIKGMLFGIERQRGRASKNDTYSKFQPWTQSGVYEGYLRVECDGQIYRIERRFQKGDKRLCVINETTGKERKITRLYGTSCAAACLKLLMIIPSVSVS
mgnify:FL=1